MRGNEYYVYVTTPKFALRSPHVTDEKRYISFPPAKIGVSVMYDDYEKKMIVGDPIVMNSYSHPFLPGRSTMQHICLGSYKPSTAKRLPADQAILTLLSKAKENLLMGYRSGRNPHNPLNKDRWNGWLTKKEVEQKELVCLNEYQR